MGLSSTIIYTSELILCSTICVPSATRHNIHLIAFVELVPAATEKVSLIRLNIVWNRWKSTLRAGSIRVNPEHSIFPRKHAPRAPYFEPFKYTQTFTKEHATPFHHTAMI